MRLIENNYLRATRAAGDFALTHFSNELWRDFRIWGGEEIEDIETILRLMPDKPTCTVKIEGKLDLYEAELFKAQILKQSGKRLPLFVTDEVLRRLAIWQNAVSTTIVENEQAAAKISKADPQTLKAFSETENEEDEENKIAKKLLQKSMREIDDFKEHVLSTYTYEEQSELAIDSLHALDKLAGKAKSLQQGLEAIEIEKMQVSEYLLNFCPARLTFEVRDGQKFDLRRLDGESHAILKKKYNLSFVEEIVTDKVGRAAERQIEYYILAIRLATHDAAINASQTQRAKYRRYGRVISVGISLLSLGQVNIPAEAVAQVLILAKAMKNARADLKELLKGNSVLFWPEEEFTRTSVYYRDFLRLFLWLKDTDKSILNFSKRLKKLYPEVKYASYQIDTSFKDKKMSYEVSYVTHED